MVDKNTTFDDGINIRFVTNDITMKTISYPKNLSRFDGNSLFFYYVSSQFGIECLMKYNSVEKLWT